MVGATNVLSARALPACDAGGISQRAKQMCCLPLGHVKTQACETEAWNRIIVCVCVWRLYVCGRLLVSICMCVYKKEKRASSTLGTWKVICCFGRFMETDCSLSKPRLSWYVHRKKWMASSYNTVNILWHTSVVPTFFLNLYFFRWTTLNFLLRVLWLH